MLCVDDDNDNESSVSMDDGATLPIVMRSTATSRILSVIAHGLGARNPKTKDHSTDHWVSLAMDAISPLTSCVTYTARGHGRSTGWQHSASNEEQFAWNNLAHDMKNVMDHFVYDGYIIGGNSMGAATALHCALQWPSKIRAVILMRVPTAWETRAARRNVLLGSADRLKEKYPTNPGYHVLCGATLSDLPPIESAVYSTIECPVLILQHENDDVHPVESAVALKSVLRNAVLHVSSSEEVAMTEWPALIKDFVSKLIM